MTSELYPIKIFLSCSQDDEDELLKGNLTKHLLGFSNQGLITLWSRSDIGAGEEEERTIDKNLREAAMILLLFSPDFIASGNCIAEMEEALKRHETENTCVIFIRLRPVHWYDERYKDLEVLPKNGKSVKLWTDKDEAFSNIVESINEKVNDFIKNQYMEKGRFYMR